MKNNAFYVSKIHVKPGTFSDQWHPMAIPTTGWEDWHPFPREMIMRLNFMRLKVTFFRRWKERS
jgi:hypothetical protein